MNKPTIANESNGDLSDVTTAQALGLYHRELMAKDIPDILADQLVLDMGRELHRHGLKINTENQ